MKKVEYKCNMCLEVTPKSHLKAMYWDGTIPIQPSFSEKKFGAYILTTDLDSCDKHICLDCITVIKES